MNSLTTLIGNHTFFLIVVTCTVLIVIGIILLGIRPHPPISEEKVMQLKSFDSEAKQRMWEHGLHEDTVFNDRQNFFLVFESVLFGVVGALLSTKTGSDTTIERLIILAGLTITLLWYYVQVREHYVIDSLKIRDRIIFEEYKIEVNRRRWWPFHITVLLAYGLPLLISLTWVILLAFLEGWHLGL